MISIRRNTFETNSSSTHSITMLDNDNYQAWVAGKVYMNRYPESYYNKKYYFSKNTDLASKEFVTLDELRKMFAEADKEDMKHIAEDLDDMELYEYDFYSYEAYQDRMNQFEDNWEMSHTTASGEVVWCLGYAGYDG